jgi:hypothetical protein
MSHKILAGSKGGMWGIWSVCVSKPIDEMDSVENRSGSQNRQT